MNWPQKLTPDVVIEYMNNGSEGMYQDTDQILKRLLVLAKIGKTDELTIREAIKANAVWRQVTIALLEDGGFGHLCRDKEMDVWESVDKLGRCLASLRPVPRDDGLPNIVSSVDDSVCASCAADGICTAEECHILNPHDA